MFQFTGPVRIHHKKNEELKWKYTKKVNKHYHWRTELGIRCYFTCVRVRLKEEYLQACVCARLCTHTYSKPAGKTKSSCLVETLPL